MVSIIIKRERQGRRCGFECTGHAGYSEMGSDIVCAGISTLTHTTMLALEKLLGIRLRVKTNASIGYLNCHWDPGQTDPEKIGLIIDTMCLGLTEIQKQYPDYLEVSEVEVQ